MFDCQGDSLQAQSLNKAFKIKALAAIVTDCYQVAVMTASAFLRVAVVNRKGQTEDPAPSFRQ